MTTKLTYSLSAIFPSGTALLFQQSAAPTGWTKQTTHNDKSLRVVSGTAGSGGSVAFSTAFASKSVEGSITVSGTVGDTTLTTSQIPSHTHQDRMTIGTDDLNMTNGQDASINLRSSSDVPRLDFYGTTESTGGGQSHTHSFTGSGSFTGTAINLAVNYVDVIIATKD
jgi:hypothetical protein